MPMEKITELLTESLRSIKLNEEEKEKKQQLYGKN